MKRNYVLAIRFFSIFYILFALPLIFFPNIAIRPLLSNIDIEKINGFEAILLQGQGFSFLSLGLIIFLISIKMKRSIFFNYMMMIPIVIMICFSCYYYNYFHSKSLILVIIIHIGILMILIYDIIELKLLKKKVI